MSTISHSKDSKMSYTQSFWATFAALILLAAMSCSPSTEPSPQPTMRKAPPSTPTPKPGAPTPTDVWTSLLHKQPFPYTTPLPPRAPTVLDGLYVKLELKQGTPVPCRRCPDYLPQGGTWKLSLDKGVFRVFHQATGWHSLGSFAVSGDQVTFFNDPHCYAVIGTYKWRLEGKKLNLEVIQDTCHVDRRARTMTNLPWDLD